LRMEILDIPPSALIVGDRIFVALRKAGRVTSGWVPVYHAVTPYCRMALCSVEPGPASRWFEPPAANVTCPDCQKRLAALAASFMKASVDQTARLHRDRTRRQRIPRRWSRVVDTDAKPEANVARP